MSGTSHNHTGMWLPDPVRADIAHIIQEVRLRWWDSTKSQWTNYLFVKKTPKSEGFTTSDTLTLDFLQSFPPPNLTNQQPASGFVPTATTAEKENSTRESRAAAMETLLLKSYGYSSVTQLSEEEKEEFDGYMGEFNSASDFQQKSGLSIASHFKYGPDGTPTNLWNLNPTTKYYYVFFWKIITFIAADLIMIFVVFGFINDTGGITPFITGFIALFLTISVFGIRKAVKTLKKELRIVKVEQGSL